MERYKDWFEQGERDLRRAEIDLEHEFYEWACFTAQQAAEKFVKALGLKLNVDLWGHSLTGMLKILRKTASLDIPDEITACGKELDKYYIPTRYPNGFAEGKPADYFTKDDAQKAISCAYSIRRFCEGYLS